MCIKIHADQNSWSGGMTGASALTVCASRARRQLTQACPHNALRKILATYKLHLGSHLLLLHCSHSLVRVGVLGLNEVLCSSNKVVKHILLVIKHSRLVPTVAILTSGHIYKEYLLPTILCFTEEKQFYM